MIGDGVVLDAVAFVCGAFWTDKNGVQVHQAFALHAVFTRSFAAFSV